MENYVQAVQPVQADYSDTVGGLKTSRCKNNILSNALIYTTLTDRWAMIELFCVLFIYVFLPSVALTLVKALKCKGLIALLIAYLH